MVRARGRRGAVRHGQGVSSKSQPAGPQGQEEVLQRLLLGVSILSLTEFTMMEFASSRGQLRRDGNLIGDMDLLIASTAIENDLTLVTRNQRHFDRVPGLDLYQDS